MTVSQTTSSRATSRIIALWSLILFLSASADANDVVASAKKSLSSLPGKTAFVFTQLTNDGPKTLYGINENERFAIGSSFKLFILGTLINDVNTDQRKLSDTKTLVPEWVGPPHSELASWPLGSPVTLNTLALKMISISDNTATDHLLHILGRERIEKQMAVMGHSHPQWNIPLLSTREMVMLRDKAAGFPAKTYLTLETSARREFLKSLDAKQIDFEKLDFDTAAYDMAEWYATPLDMAHAMAWLKANTNEDQPGHLERGVLAVDPKLPHDSKIWPYVGFKGGSEDQLLCGNWLLKNRNGNWYTFHVFCNSPNEKIDQQQAIKSMEEVFLAIQKAIDAP